MAHPLVLDGVIYPTHPQLGIFLMVINAILMGIIFSYAVLRTGSVWIAVILHLIPDTIYPTADLFIATSINPIFAFGTGILGTVVLSMFSIIILRSKTWKEIITYNKI